jgi:hypothetical protein
VVARQDVAVPSGPEDRVSAAHEKAVARVGQAARVVASRLVDRRKNQLVSTVVHVVEQAAVPFAWVRRRQQEEVGPELDLSGRVARSAFQVNDSRVGWVRRVNCQVKAADDPLV